jgi:hypothetical protein
LDMAAGLPDFSWYNIPKRVKMYQNLGNIPNGHKVCQMAGNWPNGHEIYRHLPLLYPPKSTQIGIFGLKRNHLATLLHMHSDKHNEVKT